jgi:hypothetical protein
VIELVDRFEAQDERRVPMLFEDDGGKEGRFEAMRTAVPHDAAKAAQGGAVRRRLGVVRELVEKLLDGEWRAKLRDGPTLARQKRKKGSGAIFSAIRRK